jgi:hypothetical protein
VYVHGYPPYPTEDTTLNQSLTKQY